MHRFIAWDEGFYIYAADLIIAGKIPYLDFFYPQMPLLPYLYGTPFYLTSVDLSWFSARVISAVFGAMSCLLIYFRVIHTSSIRYGLLSLVVLCGSHLITGWFTVVKSYPSCTFFMLLSYLYLVQLLRKRLCLAFLLSGLSLAIATGIRLYLIVLAPLWIIWIYREYQSLKYILYFLLGAFIGFIPTIILALINFDAFFFNNLTYHSLRNSHTFLRGLAYKKILLLKLFGITKSTQFIGYEFLLLSILFVYSGIVSPRYYKFKDPALYAGALLFFISWVPTPSYIQYFVIVVPFFCLCGVSGGFIHLANKSWGRSILILFLLFYLRPVFLNYQLYTNSGIGLTGIKNSADREIRLLSSVSETQAYLKNELSSHQLILSHWPGYLVSVGREAYKGSENHFAFRVGDKLLKQKRRDYHILSKSEFHYAIRRGRPDVVVLSTRSVKRYQSALSKGHYILKKNIAGNAIFVRSEK